MRWIIKQLGNVIGFILIAVVVLVTHWLVDFLLLSRIGLEDVPLLGSAIAIAFLIGIGWLLGKYFPDEDDKE